LVSYSGPRRLLAKAPEALKFASPPLSQLLPLSSSKKLKEKKTWKGLLLHRDEGWTIMEHKPYGNFVTSAASPSLATPGSLTGLID
jgi:hypothetical protein